jgi:hypothetical protein
MKTESMVAARATRSAGSIHGGSLGLVMIAALLLGSPAGFAAEPKAGGPGVKSSEVMLESIPGSTVKRVTLSEKAAERLGIETGAVGSRSVMHKQMVGGLITPPVDRLPETKPVGGIFGGFGASSVQVAMAPQAKTPVVLPSISGTWVSVALSAAEWERLAKNKPARILPLATHGNPGKQLVAKPIGWPPLEDMKRSMLTLYYVVSGKDHGLELGQRVRVELQISGDEKKQKVVPYGAVYYDAKGNAWVYVNSKPLVFERRGISVERIIGNLAVLSSGPLVGTSVVTVGAALLYGVEIFGK